MDSLSRQLAHFAGYRDGPAMSPDNSQKDGKASCPRSSTPSATIFMAIACEVVMSWNTMTAPVILRAIEQARAGVYPAGIAADISPERLSRFFKQKIYRRQTDLPGAVHPTPGRFVPPLIPPPGKDRSAGGWEQQCINCKKDFVVVIFKAIFNNSR